MGPDPARVDLLLKSCLPGIPLLARGKVRDVYDLRNELLIVATDRISAFDCVLPTGIPDKGRVLTQLSVFWFDFLRPVVQTHFLTADVRTYPAFLRPFWDQLEGRSMLVRKLKMAPVECVARGYVAGSGWKDYQRTGAICGHTLPPGLRESDKLPEPIFTPATKADSGHDENITREQMQQWVPGPAAGQLEELTLAIYRRAADYAASRGLILADTKLEFGFDKDRILLGDEVLTPDSSRFWPADQYRPGGPQPSYDKQYVRDYLETLPWNKQPPAPALPDDVQQRTSEKYKEAYRLLTGKPL